jgi:hypothetical protein
MELPFHSFKQYILENTHEIKSELKNNLNVETHYDVAGRRIFVKGPHNYWKVCKYNNQGNLIYSCDSEGNWQKFKYKEGKLINLSNSMGEYWEHRVYAK